LNNAKHHRLDDMNAHLPGHKYRFPSIL
jgi:hypothetical protein